jgi:hypothetical protein
MCDALSRNVPKLATGVDLLLALGEVYHNDAPTRERGLSPHLQGLALSVILGCNTPAWY